MKRFLLLFLPFSCLASQTCSDCAALYGSVYAQAVSVSNNLVNCQSHITTINNELIMMEGQMNSIINYATSNEGHYDSAINGLASGTLGNIANTRSALASLQTRLDQSVDDTNLMLLDLANFNCDCCVSSTNNITVVVTNTCQCPPYLIRIAMDLERIENGTVDYIQSISLSLWDVIEPNIQEIKRRLTIPDDDYKSDLASLFTQLNQAIAQGNDLLENSTAANINSATFNKTIRYMSNSDLALAYLYTTEYQNMIINRRSSRRLDDILSVISNLNVNVTNNSDSSSQCCDLAFISNYLYNIQRSYFEMFNSRNTANTTSQNPFTPVSVGAISTNFWYWLKADGSVFGQNPATSGRLLLSQRASVWTAYKQRYTNWWDRIEFALYGLAGGFDTGFAPSSAFNASSISNNVNQYLSSTNFVSGITAVFTDVTNSVDTLASAFKDFTDSFHFTAENEFSQSFVVCPSFQFGDFQFEGITFDMFEVRDICSIIRSSCRLVWTSLFSFLGLFLGIRFFVELGKAIAHIFVMLKTLL